MGKMRRFVVSCLAFLAMHAAFGADCGCEDRACIKDLIQQKSAMAAGYDRLAAEWAPLVRVDGQNADVVNLNQITDPAQRAAFYREVLELRNKFGERESRMAAEVGPPPACGFAAGLEVATDDFSTCIIDADMLSRAQAQAQAICRPIADLIARHEGMHRDRCLARSKDPRAGSWAYSVDGVTKVFPALLLTPAGHAREEAEGYRMEVQALQRIADNLQESCGVWSGTITGRRLENRNVEKVTHGQCCGGRPVVLTQTEDYKWTGHETWTLTGDESPTVADAHAYEAVGTYAFNGNVTEDIGMHRTGWNSCGGGRRPETWTRTTRRWRGEGSKGGPAKVRIAFRQDGNYTLVLDRSSDAGTSIGTLENITEPGPTCTGTPPAVTRSRPYTGVSPKGGPALTGQVDPSKPGELSGTAKLEEDVNGTKITHVVTWNLKRR